MNVTVTDVADVGAVQVPIGVAANLCDINVAILVEDLQDGAASCQATNESQADNSLRGLNS